MGSYDAWVAVKARFAANWTHTSIAYGNDVFTPTVGTAWVRVTMLDGSGQQTSLGSTSLDRHAGVLVVQVFTPVGEGDDRARWLADQAAAIFRKVTVSGVLFQVPGVTRVGRTETWLQMNVACPYQRDELT